MSSILFYLVELKEQHSQTFKQTVKYYMSDYFLFKKYTEIIIIPIITFFCPSKNIKKLLNHDTFTKLAKL